MQKCDDLIEVNQQDVFNDLYNFGKELNEYNITTNSIDITNWDKDRTLKINKRIYDIRNKLDNLFETYIQNIPKNEDMEKRVKELITKYGYPRNQEKQLLVSYCRTYKEILISSLYVYVIVDLLESIKEDKYYEHKNKFINFSIKKRETILFYVKNIINYQFALRPIIDYENDFRYIFNDWCNVAGLVIFAMISKIDTTTNKKYKTIPCIQCGCLFVTERKKVCSIECEKERGNIARMKCYDKKKHM